MKKFVSIFLTCTIVVFCISGCVSINITKETHSVATETGIINAEVNTEDKAETTKSTKTAETTKVK